MLLIGCLAIGLTACGDSGKSSASVAESSKSGTSASPSASSSAGTVSADGEAYEFIFVCPLIGLEYWDMCAEGIKAADEEFGTSTQYIGGSDPTMIANDLVNYFESAISSQPDGIMAYLGMETMTPLVEKAVDEGIPVIAVDSDVPDPESPRTAYVGTDPRNAGYSSGEAMIEVTGGTAKVAVLCSSVTAEKERVEIEAFKEAIADAGADIEIIATEETNADLATGVTKMQSLVQTYPEMTAVLCTSAYDVQAAAKVKEEMGLDDLHLIGYDDQEETLNFIRKGLIDAIVVQDPYQMGYMSVKLMKEYLDNGGSLDKDNYDTGTILVTQENVDSYK